MLPIKISDWGVDGVQVEFSGFGFDTLEYLFRFINEVNDVYRRLSREEREKILGEKNE